MYQSWVPSMDEGWTRWIFDQNSIPYTRVVDADLRKGDLKSKFDVLLLPDEAPRAILHGAGGREEGGGGPKPPPEFTGGMGDDGWAKVKEFTEAGGTVVALNKASQVYATNNSSGLKNALDGVTNKEFYIPGSILEVSVDPSNPIGFGSKPKVPVFFEISPAFSVDDAKSSVATYANDKPLLSGWLLGGKYLAGKSALVEFKQGKGHVVLFGFRPQYRAQSEVTYKMLFNAMLLSNSTAVELPQH